MKRLYLIGDSTCSDYKKDRRPETGWGEKIYDYLAEDWIVVNVAMNGYSTYSCLKTGTFGSVLVSSREGDAAILQFGHNDEHKGEEKGTEAFSSYVANLKYMAEKLLAKGVSVYFVTPVPRRRFDDNGLPIDSHGDYLAAMKYAAHVSGVPCVDITIPAMLEMARLGEVESRKYYMVFKENVYTTFPEGRADNTHLRPEGAEWIASHIVRGLSALPEKPAFLK